jgi:hypothetical protein
VKRYTKTNFKKNYYIKTGLYLNSQTEVDWCRKQIRFLLIINKKLTHLWMNLISKQDLPITRVRALPK